ncbi:PadR family transcriptional regulator [Sporosarcina aquimarina]|uniref:PadR family transcriptional regulator n=1 Tax=Sporosarcina aquimarina TaxID=114975 RepID=A0ABU4G1Q5_9BACL|nr:PadR family transcriptional regulator [Sporosarcina aquimarina]MDW0110883.1 PadR family transcriptional regulator [Sporosarcina aquimarina]
MDQEMMKGSIDLLILSLIGQRDMYGYEMVKVLKELSEETYEMSEGTLYAALKRLEKKSWIVSYWQQTESGRRKYYHLSDEGTKALEMKKENWEWMNALVHKSSEGLL